jgi:DNA segregation ATPase FtsK/SpoIIIE-like protein
MHDGDINPELLASATDYALRRSRGRVSAWSVQRHVRVGFATAVKLIAGLEAAGVIGPDDGRGWHAVLGEPAAKKPQLPDIRTSGTMEAN